MKVLAIRGRNLASLEDEFEIDFTSEPLLSSGIFAISGPTGAGKSTLLDAMCLALFARTPRTEQAKENNVRVKDVNDDALLQSDPRFLLRRGSASGYAETDFLALNGHRYRARWHIARAREKENGRLQNARTTLYNIDTGAEEQGSRTEIQARIIELIGLSFDQFTRSVLLAQNDFSTFLKAEQGEKASLLEKLTGTEHYSAISRKIFEKNAEAKEAFEKVRIQIEGIEIVGEEEEASLRAEYSSVSQQAEKLEKRKQEKQLLEDAVKNAEQLIAGKQVQEKEASARLTQATAWVEQALKEAEKAKAEQQQAEDIYKALQPDIQSARKLDIRLESDKQSLTEAEVSYKKAEKEQLDSENKYQQIIRNLRKGKEAIESLTAWCEKYKEKEKIAEQLSTLLLHLNNAHTAKTGKEKAQKVCDKLKKQIAEIDKNIQNIRNNANIPENADIHRSISSKREKREKLLVEQARFVTKGNIKTLRDKLTEGTACPVCGSTEHPYASPQMHREQERLTDDIAALTLSIGQLEELSMLLTERKQPAEQLPREEKEYEQQDNLLSQSLQAANELFGSDEWQTHWLQDPDVFRDKLTTFAKEWRENKEKLQQLEQQQQLWQSEQHTVEHFLASRRKQTEESKKIYTYKLEAWQKLQTERAKLFDGKPADQVEKEHLSRQELLQKKLKDLLQTQTEQTGIAEQLKGVTEQINKDLEKAGKELARHREALEKQEQRYAKSAEEGVSLEKALADIRQQKTEYAFRIRKQEENKKKIAGLQDELNTKQTVSEQWGKLNELAGSADGAKFRRIAQGYTLDVLLSYANVQLRNLSNRYYLERVPDTLALQVIDRDMCDEVRTVHSLSGGESFLVSLALALGLSSLSSNRMKVESLFIDEGFGSLDADTLRIALDALECLRTQGRKIGVISHVQEMTERIPVQIKVNRAGNGRSYLEII